MDGDDGNAPKEMLVSCPPRFSAAGMVRMKNHEKSGWVHLIWNPGQVLTAGCGETPGRARTFISDQSKEVSKDRERRRKLHRCIQTAIDSARRDWSSARRDWRLFFQTFQPSFVISWPISTNEPSLESLKSQQSDGATFVPVSPRERTIAPLLRGTHTFGSISPNPYMQRPDQFVQGRDRGGPETFCISRHKWRGELVPTVQPKTEPVW